MTKILFTNSNCSWNKGSAAQVISTASIIRKIDPEAKITLISHFPKEDSKFCNCHDIEIISSKILNNLIIKILFNLGSYLLIKIGLKSLLSKNSIIKKYEECNIIIDLSGDTLSDIGAFSPDVISSLLLSSSFKKPLIIYSQSIGPFKPYFTSLAKNTLNKASKIFIREEITQKYLEKIGVKLPLELIPDCAFVLIPSNEKKVNKILLEEKISIKRPVVGLSVNGMVGDENYIKTMANVVEYIKKDLKADVIFVPHVISRAEGFSDDDRCIGEKIYNLLSEKENVNLINGDYSPNDLKGIIKMCDMFIGGRMHANIAALSTNVPTIATSWSHKYQGIMDTLGQEKYVCNIKNIKFDEIIEIIDEVWNNKEKIRFELEKNVEIQQKKVWDSGKTFYEF